MSRAPGGGGWGSDLFEMPNFGYVKFFQSVPFFGMILRPAFLDSHSPKTVKASLRPIFYRADIQCLKTCRWTPGTYKHQIVRISSTQFGLIMALKIKMVDLKIKGPPKFSKHAIAKHAAILNIFQKVHWTDKVETHEPKKYIFPCF